MRNGVDVIYVSNHGGRQLDHGQATLETLPEVVQAVAGRVPVIVGVSELDTRRACRFAAKAAELGAAKPAKAPKAKAAKATKASKGEIEKGQARGQDH